MSKQEPRNLKKPEEVSQTPRPQLDDAEEIARDDSPPEILQKGFQRMTEMMVGVQSGPSHHPILKGIAEHPELIDKFLGHSHSQEQQKTRLNFAMFVVAIVAALLLTLLLLAYDKTEHLDAIIAAFIGLAGGFGGG